jgi:ubiquinone/menaquinone biosynthesis C-methylase UbiE
MDQRLMQVMLDVDEHHWWYRGRRAIIRRELERLPIPVGARILDVGCGSGRTLVDLARFGEVSAVERDEQAATLASARGPFDVQIGELEHLPWPAGTFQLVTCLDVLEHTRDDVLALRELWRVTMPGGWLVVTAPAYQTLWSSHDEANHHYRRYSRPRLVAAMSGAGWLVTRITSFNTVLLAPAVVVRLVQRRRRPPPDDRRSDLERGPVWMNRLLELPLEAEARWLGGGRSLPAGLSLMAVARRAAD